MGKCILTISIWIIAVLISYGQSTVFGDKLMPSVGDTSFTSFGYENFPASAYEKSGGKWNFNFIEPPYISYDRYIAPAQSKYARRFPRSNIALRRSNNSEVFFMKLGSSLFRLGEVLPSASVRTGAFVLHYDNAYTEMRLPLQVGQRVALNYTVRARASKNDFLGAAKAHIPNQADSVEFVFIISESGSFSEVGEILLNGGQYFSILKEARVNISSRVRFKSKSGDWQNFALERERWPWELRQRFPNSAYYLKTYFSDHFKNSFFEYALSDQGEVSHVRFQAKNNVGYEKPIAQPNKTDVIAYPNPTYGKINMTVLGLPLDDYTVEIYTVLGRKVHTHYHSRFLGHTISMELNMLRKGTYMYSILDKNGQKIITKRLGIISI